MAEIEDPAQAYIRDLLVASGLYDGSAEKHLSRWETLSKPISISVFEEVEESHKELAKEHEKCLRDHNGNKVDHKVLHDLLNETLSTVLAPPLTTTKFRRKIIDPSALPALHGKKLLDRVWQIISEQLYSAPDRSYYSLEDMVARDLRLTPWSGLMGDELNTLGREMETLIVEDMVDEILKDLKL